MHPVEGEGRVRSRWVASVRDHHQHRCLPFICRGSRLLCFYAGAAPQVMLRTPALDRERLRSAGFGRPSSGVRALFGRSPSSETRSRRAPSDDQRPSAGDSATKRPRNTSSRIAAPARAQSTGRARSGRSPRTPRNPQATVAVGIAVAVMIVAGLLQASHGRRCLPMRKTTAG